MFARLACAVALVAAMVAAPRAARSGNGVDLVRFMPEGSSIYLVVDVAGARDSQLFKEGMAKLVALAPGGLAKIKAAGIDPATALDTIAIGGRFEAGHDQDDYVVVAEGKQAQKIADLVARSPDVKATTYRGVTSWGNAQGSIAIVGKRLFFARAGYLERTIDLALGKARSAARAASGATLRAVIAATDTRHDVWAAIAVPPELAKAAKAAGIDVQGVSLGMSLSTDVTLEAKVLNATEASATTLLTQVETALPQVVSGLGGVGLGAAARSIQVDRDGTTVRFALTLTEAEVTSLASLMGSALGGLGVP